MTTSTRAQLVTAYGDAAFDMSKKGDALVRDVVDSMGMGAWQLLSGPTSLNGVSSLDFTSIPQVYSDLMLLCSGVSHNNGSNTTTDVSFSTDNGSTWKNLGTSLGSDGRLISSYSNAQIRNSSLILFDYASSRIKSVTKFHGAAANSESASGMAVFFGTSTQGTDAFATKVDAIRVSMAAGAFDAGTAQLLAR